MSRGRCRLKVMVHRFPRRHIMWQQKPGAPATVNVEDGIQDFTPGMLARASDELFFRKVWRDYAPFGIVEVSRVSLSGFGHSTSLPDFCRRVEFSDAL
jgi:hypothetical protein